MRALVHAWSSEVSRHIWCKAPQPWGAEPQGEYPSITCMRCNLAMGRTRTFAAEAATRVHSGDPAVLTDCQLPGSDHRFGARWSDVDCEQCLTVRAPGNPMIEARLLEVLAYSGGAVIHAYPHVCPRCRAPAYVGFLRVDCSKACK